ncbi:DNA cytosine methyltransferase [Pseudomonas aeruginosa]|uniref:DNA cytosine methyltransferase n=1 Tax=Pseudomonas aeruginosa TaxID=287 RepID=UPI003F1AA211
MNELALFSGAGGGILGGHLLGWRTVCAVEFEPYAASVLAARQNDGILPPFPIWDDVRTFDGRPWRGLVDVVSGGFPCQDISAAGNGAGIDGERSGLWREMARIVGEVRPRFVFVENSPLLVRRGLAVVLGDLTELGYDARWCVMGAADIGAPHQRDRIWIVANTSSGRRSEPSRWQVEQPRRAEAECTGEAMAYAHCVWELQQTRGITNQRDGAVKCREPRGQRKWPAEPDVGRVAHGVASRVDRIKALGNGQVPRVAAAAFTYLASEWI